MRQLGMFAKYWQAGAVKTRLAAAIGDRTASDIYCGFLHALVRRLGTVADHRVIAYTPRARRLEFQALASKAWSIELQAAGDLGRRMASFFASAQVRDDGPIVLIGSDSPTLPAEYIEQAFELLKDVPVVLGPSTDGGYYLIGASGHIPCVFTGVSWSTPDVYDQTISLLRQADCAYASLPQWYDVDDLAGLHRLRDELARAPLLDDGLPGLQNKIENALDTG